MGAAQEVYVEDLPSYGDPRWLAVENRLAEGVLEELAGRGHAVVSMGPYANLMGCAAVILKHQKTGALEGGADPRRDSQVACW